MGGEGVVGVSFIACLRWEWGGGGGVAGKW